MLQELDSIINTPISEFCGQISRHSARLPSGKAPSPPASDIEIWNSLSMLDIKSQTREMKQSEIVVWSGSTYVDLIEKEAELAERKETCILAAAEPWQEGAEIHRTGLG